MWPDYAEAYNNIAAANASKGDWQEAIRAAELAVRFKPDFPLAWNNLAWARSGAAAQEALDKSASLYSGGSTTTRLRPPARRWRLRPSIPEAYNNIAAAFASKGMWNEAIEAAEQAIRLNPISS